jgi:methionyl-tRNA formyltransferase
VRTAFLGTSEFAAAVLRGVAGGRQRPLLVVTPPNRPRGRGRQTQPPPAAEAATELGIELIQADDVNSGQVLERLQAARPDAVAVCAFGQLIREPLLSELPLVNIHPSLLPRWRGAAPIERAIMAGDDRTGVSVMRVTAGLDSGPVAIREDIEIGPDDDFEALADRLQPLGAELLIESLDRLEGGDLRFEEQDEDAATYAEKIDPSERRLDPTRSAAELSRTVRALTPHIGAYLEAADGERLGVRRAHPADAAVPEGMVRAESGELLLGCAQGTLRLEVVQPAGGNPMAADAFLRGHQLPEL